MNRHTTFRVGGPARRYYIAETPADVREVVFLCEKSGEQLYVIGNGSNLLVSDRGIDGVVLEMGEKFSKITLDGNTVYAEAGAKLSALANFAMKNSLSGLVPLSGIPGTVGGAVMMNAGAYGGEIADHFLYADVLCNGEFTKIEKDEMQFGYRHSLCMDENMIVLGAAFELENGDCKTIAAEMQELAKRRREKQPLEYPSAGSTFKRPEGYFAGKLIMDAGLAGKTVGGACVSEKHCGFILNKEHGTAGDIYNLIRLVQDEVHRQFGVTLETEVQLIGDFE